MTINNSSINHCLGQEPRTRKTVPAAWSDFSVSYSTYFFTSGHAACRFVSSLMHGNIFVSHVSYMFQARLLDPFIASLSDCCLQSFSVWALCESHLYRVLHDTTIS